jgi:formylglycine-generating enzyme required for sulfatase activity/tetratricopeptide (TPR) repeat protein
MASGYPMFGNRLSYVEYLTAQEFVDDISSASLDVGRRLSMDISRQTRDVIASNEALARENILATEIAAGQIAEATADNTRMLKESVSLLSDNLQEGFSDLSNAMSEGFEDLSGTLTSGFSKISYDLKQVSSGLNDLHATFHWGFGQMLASMGRMNDALAELIKIAKTPAQTAAYEQYEIARDAFRQALYLECLESLDKAVKGDSASSGYKLEWRFHQMIGTIRLGFVNGDMSLVDLAAAEDSFALAARYAKTDYPEHAVQAYLSAGWAAYCQGKMREGLAYTEQALALKPNLGAALFQAAKVRMALGEVEYALPMLGKAIDLDRFYALKAAGDGDFQRQDEKLRNFLEAMRDEKYRQIVEPYEKTRFWREHSSLAQNNEIVKRLDDFVVIGKSIPLFDILDDLKTTEEMLEKLYELIKANPSFSLKSHKGTGVMCTWKESYLKEEKVPIEVTYQENESYLVEEMQPVEETWQEEVVIKSAGFFSKAVTEMRTKSRTVMKAVQVNKIRSITKTHWTEETKRTITVSNNYNRELSRLVIGIYDGEFIKEMEFCLIPAGTFVMGDAVNGIIHQVTISSDFYMAKYSVTQAQWEAVMGSNPSCFKGDDRPVENVSWNNCQEFVKRLNAASENKYRLPTEAEWEYSCRAGSSDKYCFGDSTAQLDDYAWYKANSCDQTQSVGKKKANAWGLHDMNGNVWEWCQDYWYGDYQPGAVTDPQGVSGSYRIYRGGCYLDASSVTSASRGKDSPFQRCNSIGFRLVCLSVV